MLDERTIKVSSAQRRWISAITIASMDAEQVVVDKPDHATVLVLRTAPGEPPDLVVLGPQTQARYTLGKPGPACIKIRLQPGRARLLLGRSARELVDQWIPLSDMWGQTGRRLAREWAEPGRLAEALTRTLSSHQAHDLPHGDLVREAAALLPSSDVQTVAKHLHVSERHLRNLFVDGVGLPPKRFARIDRVRRVLAHTRSRPWSEIAIEAGYYDHSHLTADFRKIMGVPPSTFHRGDLPTAPACGP